MQGGFKKTGADRHDPLAETDLTDPNIVSNPHPTYGWLQENAPVSWNQQLNGWILTRYDDVFRALSEPRTSVEKLQPFVAHASAANRGDIEDLGKVLSDWMVFADPPHHTDLRRLLKDAFMPADIKALAPKVAATVAELLDAIDTDRPQKMVKEFAIPLPAMVIGDLFGLPRDEVEDLKRWSEGLGKFVLGATDRTGLYENAGAAVRDMCARFRALIGEHRDNPAADSFTNQLIKNAGELSDDALIHTLVLVLWAGHETTTNLLATSIHHLCLRPDLYQALRQNRDLVPGAVEEFLRLDGPANMLVRLAKEDLQFGGQTVRAGERMFLMLNTANRDQTKFSEPEDWQFQRLKNRHMAFGKGIHVCLGAPLARMEGIKAIEGLLDRYESIEFDGEDQPWRQHMIIRGPEELTLRLRPL
jgi:cytochrome P450